MRHESSPAAVGSEEKLFCAATTFRMRLFLYVRLYLGIVNNGWNPFSRLDNAHLISSGDCQLRIGTCATCVALNINFNNLSAIRNLRYMEIVKFCRTRVEDALNLIYIWLVYLFIVGCPSWRFTLSSLATPLSASSSSAPTTKRPCSPVHTKI
jgi:hypothetical protein